MDRYIKKYANSAKIFLLRYQLRGKLMDLHALSVQQVSDLYLGDVLMSEIRKLQKELELCLDGEATFTARKSHQSER